MKILNEIEVIEVSGGKPKFLNFLYGAAIGAITGAFVCGPPCALAGAYGGAASAGIKEAASGLTEIIHPEFGGQ